MKLDVIDEEFLYRVPSDAALRLAVSARCAVRDDGEIVASFMTQTDLGVNDFSPMLSRSGDGGRTWSLQGPIWPHLCDTHSLFCSISRSPSGDLLLLGSQTPIGTPGESFWCTQTLGIPPNVPVWAKSTDGGRSWTRPARAEPADPQPHRPTHHRTRDALAAVRLRHLRQLRGQGARREDGGVRVEGQGRVRQMIERFPAVSSVRRNPA